jgi:cysteine desulfurase
MKISSIASVFLGFVILNRFLDLMGLAASTGAACSSADNEPSHVLIAMGHAPAQARSSARFSFGSENRDEEVAPAIDLMVQAVQRMRENRR